MLRVLTYHRVDEPRNRPHLDPRLISASPADFAKQIRYVARHYLPVGLDRVLEARDGGTPLPRRAVLITFDDGYRDFLEVAWPILKASGVPAALFVPTGYPDCPERAFWWDRLYHAVRGAPGEVIETLWGRLRIRTRRDRHTALKRLGDHVKSLPEDRASGFVDDLCARLGGKDRARGSVLGWEELRVLASDGVYVGSHSESHVLLTRCGNDRVRSEVRNAQRTLDRELGASTPVLAYPNGAEDTRVRDIVAREGVALAFTQRDGQNDLSDPRLDPLRLHRTNITSKTNLPLFRLRLQTWFSHFDRWRRRFA